MFNYRGCRTELHQATKGVKGNKLKGLCQERFNATALGYWRQKLAFLSGLWFLEKG